MKSSKSLMIVVLFALACILMLPMTGCKEEGTGERMGRQADEALDDAERAADDLLNR